MNKIYEDYLKTLDLKTIKESLNKDLMKSINESGLRDINKFGKEYDKAVIFYHQDLDGVTSAIAMKEYLKRYNIETVGVSLIQYGDIAAQAREILAKYKSVYGKDENLLFVLVDFAQGQVEFNIHTDHHLETFTPGSETVRDTTPAPSNVGTISGKLSPTDIFTPEDIKVADMVDSAGWKANDIKLDDMTKAAFKIAKDESVAKNKAFLGISCYKLIDVLKAKHSNKFGRKPAIGGDKDYVLNTVVMNSSPSLVSIYSNLVKGAQAVGVDVAGLENQYKNFSFYNAKAGEAFKVPHEKIDSPQALFYMLSNPLQSKTYDSDYFGKPEKLTISPEQDIVVTDSVIINKDVVVPKEWLWNKNGVPQAKYNRYLPFKANENADHIIKYFSGLPMIQVSRNPFKEDIKVKDLEEIGNAAIEKYAEDLKSMSIDLRLYNSYLNDLFEGKATYQDVKKPKKKDRKERLNKDPEFDTLYVNSSFIDAMKPILLYKGEPISDDLVNDIKSIIDGSYEPKGRVHYSSYFDPDNIFDDVTFDFYSYCKKYSGGHKAIYNVQLSPVTPDFLESRGKDKEVTELKRVAYKIMYYIYYNIR